MASTLHSASGHNGIPLHCNICPKKPNFSDTSHLLTHVASKQHLSNYFKLRVRNDAAAQNDIDSYDRWYEQWNLEDLMRDRMTQKERRSRSSNGAAAGGRKASGAAPPVPARSGSLPMAMPHPRREPSLRNAVLDPQLEPRIKTEPNTRHATPGYMPSYDPLEGPRSYTAPMHGWGSMPYGPPSQPSSNLLSNGSDADDDDDKSSSYYAPTRTSRKRKFSDDIISWPNSLGSNHISEEQDNGDTQNDMTKLKGEIWPGMDMFDSATPDMRRKRNQKKATSVLVQLQVTSENVTPTELIFDSLGQFKRERVISGEPNEGEDPLRGETSPEPDEPPVKKAKTTRRRGPRAALAEKDPNGGRNLRSTRRKGSHLPVPSQSRPRYVDGSDDIDEDDALTYGQQLPAQRRSGLSIHRDNSGPDITFERPSGMAYLTSSLSDPFSNAYPNNQNTRPEYGYSNAQHSNNGYPTQVAQTYGSQPNCATTNGFRPTDPHPQSVRDLSAFGDMNHSAMYQLNQHQEHKYDGAQLSSHSFPPYQPQYSPAPQTHPAAQNFMTDPNLMQTWDVFAMGNEQGISPLDMNFNVTETIGMNPLFLLESDTGLPEDDEATISAPTSDRSPQ